jgi:GT2 family glycosyltransferase
MTTLSIILVNWNCLAFTEECVASIFATVKDVDFEVIVVDNASADAPCQSLANRFPDVKLLLSEKNLGFGGANNLGARSSSAKLLFFLNPDTLLLGNAVQRMLNELMSRPRAGIIGCRLLNPDRTLQLSSIQRFPTILNQLLALEKLQRWWPKLSIWGKKALYSTEPCVVEEVDVVSGAGLMMRREAFEQVGGFSPEYFMFAEEVALCHAAGRAGWRVLHCSGAEVVHFGGQSTKKREDGFADVAMRDSVFLFLSRTRGGWYALLYRFGLFVSTCLRLALLGLLYPMAATMNRPSYKMSLLRALRKWLRIGSWCLGASNRIGGQSQSRIVQATTLD